MTSAAVPKTVNQCGQCEAWRPSRLVLLDRGRARIFLCELVQTMLFRHAIEALARACEESR